ncbi:MAG: GAF domain-containing protein [Anaerolineae bacterium]|nr:GAF domain-containing protein [Anaerolineae bacterium]
MPEANIKGTPQQTEQERIGTVRWVIRAGAVGAFAAAVINLLIYFKEGHWQMLALAAGELLALLLLLPAVLANRRGNAQRAGYWVLFSMILAFGFGELLHASMTLFFVGGGVLIILISANIIFPQKWVVWVVATLAFILMMVLINVLAPVPRYDLAHLIGLRAFAILLMIFLVTIALWRLLRAYQHINTIRNRLLVAFVLIVVGPMVVIMIASVAGGIQSGIDLAATQLEAVATLKESEIDAWLQTLQVDLASMLGGEAIARYTQEILAEDVSQEGLYFYRDALRGRFNESVELTGRFETVFLLNASGHVVVSTDLEQEGRSYRGWAFFQAGLEESTASLTWELGTWWLDAAYTVRDDAGNVVGVLVGRATLETLDGITSERIGLGASGETYLVSSQRAVLTSLRAADRLLYMPEESFYASMVDTRANGSAQYSNYANVAVVGVYHWLPSLRVALVAEQAQAEALQATYSALFFIGLAAAGAVGAAVIAALVLTRDIATPLIELAETATRISEGDLNRSAELKRDDEIGAVARAFNLMTARLRELIGTLEQRVTDRTQELEQRTTQLETAAQVARETLAIRDLNELLRSTTGLISNQFGFYHVGIFLVDETGKYAVLMASNSEGGKKMIARGHRLPVGHGSIVGYVANTGEPRISINSSSDSLHRDNPDLPLTRSELAIPLKAGQVIIGVLDVQTTEASTFTEDDVKVLQILGDQVAVAIQNSRLISQTQTALAEVQSLHRQYLQREWREVTAQRGELVHEYTRAGAPAAAPERLPESQRAVREGEIVVRDPEDSGGNGAGVRAALSVPIKLRDQVIGVIDIQETDMERRWSADDIHLAQTISDQMAQALENVRLFEDARVRAEELAALNDLSQTLATAMTVDDVLESAYKGSSRLIDTTNFYIATYDAEKDEISFLLDVSHSRPQEQVTVFSSDQGMTGYIVRNKQIVFIKEDLPKEMEALGIELVGEPALCYLGVPLMIGDEVLGAMAVQSYTAARAFSEHDRGLLTAIANQTAIALQKAYLFEDTRLRAEELAVLNELGQALAGSLTIQDVLQEAYNGSSRLVDTTNFYIALYDEQDDTLKLAFNVSELEDDGHQAVGSFPASQGMSGYIVRTRKSLLIKEDTAKRMAELGIPSIGATSKSWLGVPLTVGPRILGVMAVQSYTRPFSFNEHDEDLLTGVANQTAIALQNAYLFEEIQVTLEETETLYNASRRIASANTMDEIVAAVAEEVQAPAINRAMLWVAEYNLDGEVDSFVAAANWYREQGTSPLPLPLGTRMPAQAFLSAYLNVGTQPMFVDDVVQDGRVSPQAGQAFAEQNVRALALLPLQTAQRQIGILILTGEEPYRFGEREVRPYRSLAGQTTVAVESIRLLEETRRRAQELEAINDTGRLITSVLDMDVLIRQVVDTTKARFGHYFVGIMLMENDELTFRIGSTIGDTGERLEYQGYLFDLDTPGVITDAARTRQPVMVPDVTTSPRYIAIPELAKTRSEIAIPIEAKGELIGVLDVQSERRFAYDQINVLLLQSLASQAGIAIQNARMFNEAEQTAWREQTAREIIAKVQAAADIDSILQVAVRELGKALDTPRAVVQLNVHSQTGGEEPRPTQ